MPKQQKKKMFVARVVRFKMEAAFLTFESTTTDEKKNARLAEMMAQRISNREWEDIPLDPAHRDFHVLDAYEIDRDRLNKMTEHGEPEEKKEVMEGHYENTRYIVLVGNLENGVGKVLWEPWLKADNPSLTESDIASDWINELTSEGIDLAAKTFDEMAARGYAKPSDKIILANTKGRDRAVRKPSPKPAAKRPAKSKKG